MVTPGVAEALLATALGLVAAIPAVMIYKCSPARRRIIAASSARCVGGSTPRGYCVVAFGMALLR